MLSIGKLAAGQQRYYDQQVAQGHDDYYSGRGEAPGTWLGAGADALGLSGPVSASQFNALLAGRDPTDPNVELRGRRASKVAALDLTFSAPKSVSVLFAVGAEWTSRALVDSHEAAVRETVAWLEGTAVEVRRGAGGMRSVPATGLIAASYRHRMSRALDPQLHTHVVAANLAEGPDGRYTALNGTPLYRSAKTAGYLYQAHLRAEVSERLGLAWGPVRKGAAELEAVPAAVLEEFSRRRHEMTRAAEAGGFSLGSKRSSEAAALNTRERKQYGIETHTWREEVLARAAEHGLTRDVIDGLFRDGQQSSGLGRAIDDANLDDGLAGQLVGEAGLTERANTFDDRLVLQALAQAAAAGAHVQTVAHQSHQFSQLPEVLATIDNGMTTVDLIACEEQLIAAAVDRAGADVAIVTPSQVALGIANVDRPLTDEQRRVVESVASSGNGVDVIEALAGTGKTYTAGALRRVFAEAGYQVLGAAPTGRAARELADEAGIPARTIDRILIDIQLQETPLPDRAVLILDEAGMAPTRPTARLLAHARESGVKVVAIGDSGQLPSVLAGGWMKAVGQRIGELRLSEVHRQRDPEERRALGALHDGNPERFLSWASSQGRVHVIDQEALVHQTIERWIDAVQECGIQDAVMITRDNETRLSLNTAARRHRQAVGELTEQQLYGRTELGVGDRVICRNNDSRLGVQNGTRGTVHALGPDRVVIETDGGARLEIPAGYVVEHVEHAYCLTGNGMQGATVERAVVAAPPEHLTRGWSYSALSRARDQTTLLIADGWSGQHDSDDIAPVAREENRGAQQVLAAVARRMLVRDDEDLAVDQLPPDTEARTDAPSQTSSLGVGAKRSTGDDLEIGLGRLSGLHDQTKRVERALSALPTRDLARFEEIGLKHQDVIVRMADREEQLARLAAERRFGRHHGDRADGPRGFMTEALAMDRVELARLDADRESLTLTLGDPARLREEQHELERSLRAVAHERDQLIRNLSEEIVRSEPSWLTEALGPIPGSGQRRQLWERTAQEVITFRLEHGVQDTISPLGPEPRVSDPERREWQRAANAVGQAQRALGRDPGRSQRVPDIGIG